MELSEIRREHRRITRRSTFKQDRPIPETEAEVIARVERMTRRRNCTRVIAGPLDDKGRVKHYLFKKVNNMI